MTDFFAYYNKSEVDHESYCKKYLSEGYKYISLSLYGTPQQPLYAGVLLARSAPNSQVEAHGMSWDQWQQTRYRNAKDGWGPVIVVATGPFQSAVYAAVFEKMDAMRLAKVGLPATEFDGFIQQDEPSKLPGLMLTWAGVFGSADDRRYIGIWSPNHRRIVWNASRLGPDENQQWFDASNSQWARQVFSVYCAEFDEYISIYRDDAPTNYQSFPAMSPVEYQKTYDEMVARGYIPWCVQGSGSNDVRLTAIFVNPASTGQRVWTAPQGPTPAPSLRIFEDYMQAFMQEHRVRAGALAVAKGTRLVFARGYTFAEEGYPVTQPDSVFRIASCGKLITAVAILQLVEKNAIGLKDFILGRLPDSLSRKVEGYANVAGITVDDLLSMISGYGDLIWDEVSVAKILDLPRLPITKEQRAQATMATQFLTDVSGSSAQYSNLGYSLLGQIIEKATKATYANYADYVKANILRLVGIKRARIAAAAADAQPSGSVIQHDLFARNARTVLSGRPDDARPWLPLAYGGEDYSTYDSVGGWTMAAVDYAAFLAAMNSPHCPYFTKPDTIKLLSEQNVAYQTTLKRLNPEYPFWARGWSLNANRNVRWWAGTLPNTGCFHSLDDNQVAIVAFMNTGMNDIDTSYWDDLPDIAWQITDWGSDDFFPMYGLKIP